MGIMDNEGHDPLGFGNILSHTDGNDLRRLKAENARLRAAAQAVLSNAGAIEGDAMHVRVSRLLIGPLRSAVEQSGDAK